MLPLALLVLGLLQDPPLLTGFVVSRHELVRGPAQSLREVHELPPVDVGFREALVSWNVDCPDGAGFCVELRVRPDAKRDWSEWLYVGDWGALPALEKRTECEFGRIATDFFQSKARLESVQVRVRTFGAGKKLVLRRLDLTLLDRERSPGPPTGSCMTQDPDPAVVRLAVPFRSQRVEDPLLAGKLCSPTSLSMVMAFRGVDVPTLRVAERAFDPACGIYGNWPRNVQAAYSFGVPGYVTVFREWMAVRDSIARGQPLVISIAAKEGELTGAPYKSTDGHLLVLCGFDREGNCLVNDPAAPDAASGMRTYQRAELERCWMGHGGTAYVLLAPKKP